jgi:hypothetical protein
MHFFAFVASKDSVKASELALWKERLLDIRTSILAEGDVAIEPTRKIRLNFLGSLIQLSSIAAAI